MRKRDGIEKLYVFVFGKTQDGARNDVNGINLREMNTLIPCVWFRIIISKYNTFLYVLAVL